MIEFYNFLYAGGSAPSTSSKYRKYIPEMEKPNALLASHICRNNEKPSKCAQTGTALQAVVSRWMAVARFFIITAEMCSANFRPILKADKVIQL